jgi:hypothetical protein
MKQYIILIVHQVYDDAIALRDIFILSKNSRTIILASRGSSAIIKIYCSVDNLVFLGHKSASLKMNLLAYFLFSYVLKVLSIER